MTQVLYTIGRTNPLTGSNPEELVTDALRWATSVVGIDSLHETPEEALDNAAVRVRHLVSVVKITIEEMPGNVAAAEGALS